MKIILAVILSLFMAFLLYQTWSFAGRENAAAKEAIAIQAELQKAQADLSSLQSDYEFLQNPDNLEKELRARFNYKVPGEKLIIIVPPSSTATSTSQ